MMKMLKKNKRNIVRYLKYYEGVDKFPNIKKMDIDGFSVYIGKDAKSNDYLTFNISEISDIWMHVKGFPGSHSVILIRENLPTPEVIRKVAELTKKNSKAKSLPNITVIYCKRKFVRKVNGQNDGQVTVDYKNTNEIII
jgi:predicted ribosome quality control (RQC) complex YloA/Tae2 family protein